MDEIDRAQRQEELFLAASLANRARPPAGPSATICDECEEPIPEKRRQAVPGCRLCLNCQQMIERGEM